MYLEFSYKIFFYFCMKNIEAKFWFGSFYNKCLSDAGLEHIFKRRGVFGKTVCMNKSAKKLQTTFTILEKLKRNICKNHSDE